jgi:hypothetical protein
VTPSAFLSHCQQDRAIPAIVIGTPGRNNCRCEEKEWERGEKEKYTQTTISISDGEQVFPMRHRHDQKPWERPKLFQFVRIRVTRASTEKGQITVGGVNIG